MIKESWEYYLPDKQKLGQVQIEEESEGEKRLKALLKNLEILDGKGFKRARHQVKFHKAFIGNNNNLYTHRIIINFYEIGASLKKILKEDINNNLTRIIEKYNLNPELTNDVIITTPRRFGKTYSVALFVAAYLLSQPNCEVSIYSTGRRASQKLLVLIKKLVIILAGTEDVIIEFSHKETLTVRGPGGQPSVCNSYPSKVEISVFIIASCSFSLDPVSFRKKDMSVCVYVRVVVIPNTRRSITLSILSIIKTQHSLLQTSYIGMALHHPNHACITLYL
jgi:hypothetical protein